MGQRNMLCVGQMSGLEMNQQFQGYLYPEPCFLVGGRTNFPQPNLHTASRASGSMNSYDVHNSSEHYGNSMYYGRTQFNGFQDHHPSPNLDLGVATTSNLYNSYLAPPSGGALLPVPLNHGSSGQLPLTSKWHSQFMDGIEGSCKMKNAEGFPGNFQYYNNASAGSSSLVIPFSTRHNDGLALVDGASMGMPRYRSCATGVDPVPLHTNIPFIQGGYMGQTFQLASSHLPDQQSSSNCNGTGASTWTQTPAITYTHGNSVNNVGYMDPGNMNAQRYHETASNRSSTSFPNPPAIIHQYNMHHPPPHMQGMRGPNMNFYPQVAPSSYYVPTNSAPINNMSASMDGLERESRHLGSVHQERVRHAMTLRYRNLPHLRMLPADEVAILEFPNFNETGNFDDHHRDMRMDIENMSYEELLALGDWIGNVNNGLTKESIASQLKTRKYVSSATSSNLEGAESKEWEADSCIICQAEYKNQETIGTLNCGHEYHADCLKEWLLVKNVCAICKCEALTTDRKGE